MDLSAAMEEVKSKERVKAFKLSSSVKELKLNQVSEWGKTDPSRYSEVYPVKHKLTSLDKLDGAFLNGKATHGNALLTRNPVMVLPGMFSQDEDFLLFLRNLSTDLDANFKTDLDSEGFTKTGLYATFDNLRCPAGYFQTPMSYTTVDNASYREELGLTAGYSAREKAIATEFWRIIFSEVEACPVNVAKNSTGGMRRFTKDVQWKLDFANFITQPDNFERMLNAVEEGDALTLANEFETIFATYIQKRGQVDRVGKKRMVMDLTYAITGGAAGSMQETDKKVRLHGQDWDDFSAVRARVVHAGPWTINCYLQMIASPTMQSMFHRFPSTFHVNTAAQLKAVIDGHYIYCSDVTEYDRSMSKDAIRLVHDVMEEFWDKRLVKASWKLFTSPYYAKPLGLESGEGTWVKNPLKWEEVFAGNRSGHALTSLVAKGNKVVESLFIIDKLYPVLGRVQSFLEHKGPVKLVNNGDDEVVAIPLQDDMRRFVTVRQGKKNGHYLVEPEPGQGYSGMLIHKTDKPLIYDPKPKLHTSLLKTFVPEKGINDPMRADYWPIGASVRIDNLTQTDLGREIWQMTLHHYRRMLEPRHGDIRAIIAKAHADMRLVIDGRSQADREVLDDADKIHYRWLPSEVSPDVLALKTTKVPQPRVETILSRYYAGHVH